MFAVIQEQIDGLIGGVKTDLEQCRITTNEIGIKIGQLWFGDDGTDVLYIVTKVTSNVVGFAQFFEGGSVASHTYMSVSDFIKSHTYSGDNKLEKGKMWEAAEDALYPFKDVHDDSQYVKIYAVKKNAIVIEPDEIYDDEYNESNLDLGEVSLEKFFSDYIYCGDED